MHMSRWHSNSDPPPCLLLVQDLGAAALSKRPTSCMLILPQPPKGPVDAEEQKEYAEAYEEAEKKIRNALPEKW